MNTHVSRSLFALTSHLLSTGCPIYITAPGEEEAIQIANPSVSISGIEGNITLAIINLPNFKSNDLPSIESSTDYPLFSEWIKSDENALLNTTSLDRTMCANLPDFRTPLPSFDGAGSPGLTMPGVFPSIFAKSYDEEIGSEVVFLYDRHLVLLENTVDNPVSFILVILAISHVYFRSQDNRILCTCCYFYLNSSPTVGAALSWPLTIPLPVSPLNATMSRETFITKIIVSYHICLQHAQLTPSQKKSSY